MHHRLIELQRRSSSSLRARNTRYTLLQTKDSECLFTELLKRKTRQSDFTCFYFLFPEDRGGGTDIWTCPQSIKQKPGHVSVHYRDTLTCRQSKEHLDMSPTHHRDTETDKTDVYLTSELCFSTNSFRIT